MSLKVSTMVHKHQSTFLNLKFEYLAFCNFNLNLKLWVTLYIGNSRSKFPFYSPSSTASNPPLDSCHPKDGCYWRQLKEMVSILRWWMGSNIEQPSFRVLYFSKNRIWSFRGVKFFYFKPIDSSFDQSHWRVIDQLLPKMS